MTHLCVLWICFLQILHPYLFLWIVWCHVGKLVGSLDSSSNIKKWKNCKKISESLDSESSLFFPVFILNTFCNSWLFCKAAWPSLLIVLFVYAPVCVLVLWCSQCSWWPVLVVRWAAGRVRNLVNVQLGSHYLLLFIAFMYCTICHNCLGQLHQLHVSLC